MVEKEQRSLGGVSTAWLLQRGNRVVCFYSRVPLDVMGVEYLQMKETHVAVKAKTHVM